MSKSKLQWETIDKRTHRLKVLGGWIIRSSLEKQYQDGAVSVHQIFISDVAHQWSLNE